MSKKQEFKGIRLILGDQLNPEHSWYKEKDFLYTFMEIRAESEYVSHHIQKIVGIFSAMRAFAKKLQGEGLSVRYFKIGDDDNQHSFKENILSLYETYGLNSFEYQEPDEWRLDEILASIDGGRMVSSEHFFSERNEVEDFFEGSKTYLMERFYRYMRKKHDVLMEGDKPHTGKWNYDKSNRKKLPKDINVPSPLSFSHDVSEIHQEILNANLPFIGNIDLKNFIWPISTSEANELLDFFIKKCFVNFGDYQDSLTNEHWSVFHSRISFALNVKLISPVTVVKLVEKTYYEAEHIDIATTEGFIRQILGWREYMRGLYWAKMPGYKEMNFFENKRPLPDFYWSGKTKMQCLSTAIKQSLDHAYAHHIQRLMVTGNFALLAGISPDEVDLWYLGIYIDAFEWVEITNTRGMSQYADGGIVATKPYVSSASYIHKMGDHCVNCHYDHKKKVGDKACPFNSLYWNFIDEHRAKFKSNPRMGMMLALWEKMDGDKKAALLEQSSYYLDNLNTL